MNELNLGEVLWAPNNNHAQAQTLFFTLPATRPDFLDTGQQRVTSSDATTLT